MRMADGRAAVVVPGCATARIDHYSCTPISPQNVAAVRYAGSARRCRSSATTMTSGRPGGRPRRLPGLGRSSFG